MVNFSSLHRQGITAISTDKDSPTPLETYKTPPTRTAIQLRTLDTRLQNKEIGIAILCGVPVSVTDPELPYCVIALDIDTDDDLILSACPPSPVSRKGTKGEARFYKFLGTKPPLSVDYYDYSDSNSTPPLVVELKASARNGTGSLCHIPPSPHKPYRWLHDFDSFSDSLPVIDLDQLKKDLAVIGIKSKQEAKQENKIARETREQERNNALALSPATKEIKETKKSESAKSTDADLVKEVFKCLPCEMSYAEWRDSAYVARSILGDDTGRQVFTDYVNACPEYATKDSTWLEVEDFFTREYTLPSLNGDTPSPASMDLVGVGTLIKIAKDLGVDLKNLPGSNDLDPAKFKGQSDSNGNRIYAVNKNFVELANKLVYEYKYFIWLAGCIHAYNENRWCPVKNTDTLEVVLAQILINNNLNWVAPPDENKKYYRTLNLGSNHLANLVKQIKGMVEWSGNADNYRPNTWMKPPVVDGQATTPPHVEARGGTIPLQNMLIDILGSTDADGSGIESATPIQAFKFSPFYLNTSVLPFSFDPDASCPYFLNSLRASFGEGSGIKGVTEEVIANNISELQKVFGYILSEKFHNKKIFVFAGKSDAGKSSIMRVMAELVGSEYVKAGDKKMMQSQFGYENLDKAKLLTMDEYSISFLNSQEVNSFKEITGKATIRIEPKGKPDYMAIASAVPVLTTNTTPESFRDPGAGLVNRMVFYYMHPLNKMDDDYFDKIKEELPGIFNWALEGALRLLSGEKICQPIGYSAEFKAIFVDSSVSPLERFITECVREYVPKLKFGQKKDPRDGFMYLKEIHSRYVEWFDSQGYSIKDKQFDAPYSSTVSFGIAFKTVIKNNNTLSKITPKRLSASNGYKNIAIANFSDLDED